jgi:hypothetical protein
MRLKKDEVFNHFRSLIGYDDLVYHILPGMDGKIFDIDGASYKVIPGGGQKPRKIEPIEGDSPTPLPTATQEPTTPPAPAPPDTSLDVYEVHCKYCQAVYDPLDDHVCPECGAPTAAPEPTPEPKPVQMTSGIIHEFLAIARRLPRLLPRGKTTGYRPCPDPVAPSLRLDTRAAMGVSRSVRGCALVAVVHGLCLACLSGRYHLPSVQGPFS